MSNKQGEAQGVVNLISESGRMTSMKRKRHTPLQAVWGPPVGLTLSHGPALQQESAVASVGSDNQCV